MGARKRTQLVECLRALDVHLTAEEMAGIEAAIPPEAVAGTRYDGHHMQALDSEK
jgi:aryl-alcohol dehydrogenase-like predicted oxidoreductase